MTIDPSTDGDAESDETAILTVASGTGYNVEVPTRATGTITNDDTDVTVAVSPSSVDEDGVPDLEYTFTRNGVTAGVADSQLLGRRHRESPVPITPQTGADTFDSSSGLSTVTLVPKLHATVTIDSATDTDLEANETVDPYRHFGYGLQRRQSQFGYRHDY